MNRPVRSLSLLLVVAFAIGLTACGKPETPSSSSDAGTSTLSSSLEGEGSEVDTSDPNATQPSAAVSGTDNTSNATTTKAKGPTKATTTTTVPVPQNTVVENDIKVNAGKKPMEEGLNFGGKTFTIAFPYTLSAADKRAINKFQTTFNCKLKVSQIAWADYLAQIAVKMTSETPFDIVYMHGTFFPQAAISRLLAPLAGDGVADSPITTADLVDTSNLVPGAIDLSKSSYYGWGKKLYAVSSYDKDISLMIMYYNKRMFEDAGLEDPRELYEKGKWTWDKFHEMGKEVTNEAKKIYFTDNAITQKVVVLANGAQYVKYDKGSPKQNLGDSKVFNAYKIVQNMAYGKNKIVNTEKGTGVDPSLLLAGSTYIWAGDSSGYYTLLKSVGSSTAFGKSAKNIGVVPVPTGPDNKEKATPAAWITGFGAGRGTTDTRAAVAWQKFSKSWVDPVPAEYSYSAEDKKLLDKLYKKICYMNHGYGVKGDDSMEDVIFGLETEIAAGADIAQTLKNNSTVLTNIINKCLNAQ